MSTPEYAQSAPSANGAEGPDRRDAVLTMLRDAHAEQRLTLGEYTDRVNAASRAATPDELDRAAADVPPGPAVEPDREGRRTVAIMAGSSRRGPWHPAERTSAVAIMGGCELDLRDAYIEGSVLEVRATAVMGGVKIVVPDGVQVSLTGWAVMGGKSSKVRNVRALPGTPRVNVRARAFWGGVSVVNKRRSR